MTALRSAARWALGPYRRWRFRRYLRALIAREFADRLDAELLEGSGAGNPQGIATRIEPPS